MRIPARVATAALAAFAVFDIVLVAVALRSSTSTPAAAGSDVTATSSLSPTTSPSPSPSPSPKATTTPTATPSSPAQPTAPRPLRVEVMGVSTSVAWRIGVGSCDKGGASVSVTGDGGKTWQPATAPLSTILRLKAVNTASAFVIGAESACAPTYASTGNGGATWSTGGPLDRAWYRDPAKPAVVHAPGPATSTPCGRSDVLDLAVVSYSQARVLCAGGTVRSTADAGASWSSAGTVRGAVALAVPPATPSRTYLAVLGQAGCGGVVIERLGGQATSCAPAPATPAPGTVALAVVDGGGWLTVGERTLRSTDSLSTWTAT